MTKPADQRSATVADRPILGVLVVPDIIYLHERLIRSMTTEADGVMQITDALADDHHETMVIRKFFDYGTDSDERGRLDPRS